jgi:2-hydroxychromene-2-carboxylate isomerase
MTGLIADIGGDPTAYEAWAEGQGRNEHERVIDEAEAIGVFGVPMFVLDGELFWGGDRIDMLIERLGKLRAGQAPTA